MFVVWNCIIDVSICGDPSGGAGFPGGAPPFGMAGLNELFNDPEVLMAMQVKLSTRTVHLTHLTNAWTTV